MKDGFHTWEILESEILNDVISVALDTLDELRDTTPVLTGHARSNWILSIDTPDPNIYGSKKEVSTVKQRRARHKIKSLKTLDEDIYISNNVAYIPMLDHGWSAKAPAGFIDMAIKKALAKDKRRGK